MASRRSGRRRISACARGWTIPIENATAGIQVQVDKAERGPAVVQLQPELKIGRPEAKVVQHFQPPSPLPGQLLLGRDDPDLTAYPGQRRFALERQQLALSFDIPVWLHTPILAPSHWLAGGA